MTTKSLRYPTASEKQEMRQVTEACWWTKPICWSGIRNDLEKQAKLMEALSDVQDKPEEQRAFFAKRAARYAWLAIKANEMVFA